MSKIALKPVVLTDCEFLVDVDDYVGHVSRVEFVPTTPTFAWKGLTPSSAFNKAGTSTWVCNVEGAQDWETPKSLARYLLAHAGQEKTVKFKPTVGAGMPAFEADVTIAPPPIGGAVDTVAVFTISMPVSGAPTPDFDDNPVTPNPAD
jgi:hypothetical protein